MAHAKLSAAKVRDACLAAITERKKGPVAMRDDRLGALEAIWAIAVCAQQDANGTGEATITLTGEEAILIVAHFPVPDHPPAAA